MQNSNNQNNQPPIVTPTSAPESLSPTSSASVSASAVTTTETQALIKTSKGDINLSLYPDAAPKTVANFINKANSGDYKNLTFHRVEDWVIQGGDPLGNGTGGGEIATEISNKPFVIGSLGVARGQDIKISNDSQFFITKTEASWLNGQYTNFGLVISGMEVVNQIQVGDKILDIIIK
ncbi:MAG: peptidylprolyl isomerase [Candidatus Gottesmanbacteria bacterium]